MLAYGSYDAGDLGMTVGEWFVSGVAAAYSADPLSEDGRWEATVTSTAPFTTRIVTLLPRPEAFNGTVVVEWLNVTGGIDSPPVWLMTHRHLARAGYAFVGVSAQRTGLDGGTGVRGPEHLMGPEHSLKSVQPERYGDLQHPGDAFSYDIFSQVGLLLKGESAAQVFDGVTPRRLIAAGKAQGASWLSTYVNAVDPLACVYDGFLILSRLGAIPGLEEPTQQGDASGRIAGIRMRPEQRAPVLVLVNEGDLLDHPEMIGYRHTRQPDGERLRIWELAGAAHADSYAVGPAFVDTGLLSISELAAALAPTRFVMGEVRVEKPINFAPHPHYVAHAALDAVANWVTTGTAPPSSPRIELTDIVAGTLAVDEHGLAKGGIRTPWVDVPTARLSSTGDDGTLWSAIFGVTELFSPDKLNELYPGGKEEYLERFQAGLEKVIEQGFLLEEDRAEMIALAEAMYPASRARPA